MRLVVWATLAWLAVSSSAAAQPLPDPDRIWLTATPADTSFTLPGVACAGGIRAYHIADRTESSPESKAYATFSAPAYGCYTRFEFTPRGPVEVRAPLRWDARAGCDVPTPLKGQAFRVQVSVGGHAVADRSWDLDGEECRPDRFLHLAWTFPDVGLQLGPQDVLLVVVTHWVANPAPASKNLFFVVGSGPNASFLAWGSQAPVTASSLGPPVLESIRGPLEPSGLANTAPGSQPPSGPGWPMGAAFTTGLLALPAARWFVLRLYARIGRNRAADHPTRRTMLDCIVREPGIPVHELAERLELGRETARHHIRVLAATGLIVLVRAARRWHAFLPGQVPAAYHQALSRLHSTAALRVAAAILLAPGTTQEAVAKHTGIRPSTVHWHVHRLASWGLIAPTHQAGRVTYQATPLLKAIEPLVPGFEPTGRNG